MKKIKASDILAMNPELSLEKIQWFRYFAIDKDGEAYLYKSKPYQLFTDCFDSKQGEQFSLGYGFDNSNWKESIREINFSELNTKGNTENNEIELIQVCKQFVSDFELGCVLDGKIVGSPAVALVDLYNKFKQILETNEHEEN